MKRSFVAFVVALVLVGWAPFSWGCETFSLLSESFRTSVRTHFARYNPGIPVPIKGPPFVGEAQKLYHFLLHGSFEDVSLPKASATTKSAVIKLLMDGIASTYPDFKSFGPVEVDGLKVFHGRFGSFLVLYPDGTLYLGVRNPVNGRPVRGQEYLPEDMARFLHERAEALANRQSVPEELALTPLEEYLRGSIESYASPGAK